MSMPSPQQQTPKVTLDNCADEPIHIPGSIQPHGALLVFNGAAELVAWSANAADLLQLQPSLGAPLAALALGSDVHTMVLECIEEMAAGEASPMALETLVGEHRFDCITHAHQDQVIVEFELRDVPSDMVTAFALKAHSAIERLKRQKTVLALLQMAVAQIRAITGFDRVMAYQFRQDDSGDVTAEAARDDLEPYLGRRYPASDIPVQARRLYIISTLRLIADVAYQPVPVLGRTGAAPLDMSHCVLRSVSPIHIEYLQNMGVAASMSVSIVVNGRLWGLIACHHTTPKQVPYSIRMAADVMAQVLASTVQTLETRERAELIEQSAEVRTRLMETLLHNDDALAALALHADAVCRSFDADALIVAQNGRLLVHGPLDAALAAAIVKSLPAGAEELVRRETLADWPQPLHDSHELPGKWVGMLALRFDPALEGWLVALRQEQVESVRWAGQPDKVVRHGPLGARLTPRGSFDEWRETVRGRAEPWQETRIVIARNLLAEMHRASMARHAETDRARAQLLAMLGHDLRDPLHSINMAATVLEMGGPQQTAGKRIKASSGRMQRLISQVLDMSRINGGMQLGAAPVPFDFVPMLHDLFDEFRIANPAVQLLADLPAALVLNADSDRMAQVISNLLSNARHHGELGQPVLVSLASNDGQALLAVRNSGAPIALDIEPTLYNPFKRTSLDNARNRGGMGLGLYIAQQIVAEHGGAIAYSYAAPHVVFTVTLPLA